MNASRGYGDADGEGEGEGEGEGKDGEVGLRGGWGRIEEKGGGGGRVRLCEMWIGESGNWGARYRCVDRRWHFMAETGPSRDLGWIDLQG